MGDVLGSVLGGGQRTSQETQVDPTTQALNRMRQQQLQNVFNTAQGDVYGATSGAYQPTEKTNQLFNWATQPMYAGGGPSGTGNNLTLEDYRNTGQNLIGGNLGSALNLTGATTGNALTAAGNTAASNYASTLANFGSAIDRSNANRNLAFAGREADYGRGYNDIINAGSNYVNRIATPQVMQQLALQGMEGSGAAPQAIANASANVSADAIRQLVSQYMGAGTALNQQAAQEQAGLGGQYMGQQAQTLANLLSTQAGLEGQQAQTQAGLYNAATGAGTSFLQSLPGAYTSINMLPEQQAAARAGTATTLFPMAEQGGQLQREDLARRQGLFQTALTGIPYTPSTSTTGRQSQQPLFNFFGQG